MSATRGIVAADALAGREAEALELALEERARLVVLVALARRASIHAHCHRSPAFAPARARALEALVKAFRRGDSAVWDVALEALTLRELLADVLGLEQGNGACAGDANLQPEQGRKVT